MDGIQIGQQPAAFADASLPTASASNTNVVVYNSTYNVLMRSNGTRWIPLSSIVIYAGAPGDAVTGTTDETALRSVAVPLKYVGSKGRLMVIAASTNTNNANNKTLGIKVDANSGTGGTALAAVVSTTTGKSISKSFFAAGSESAQFRSATTATADATAASTPGATTIDFTGTGYVNVTGTLASAGDTMTLTGLQVIIHPGF